MAIINFVPIPSQWPDKVCIHVGVIGIPGQFNLYTIGRNINYDGDTGGSLCVYLPTQGIGAVRRSGVDQGASVFGSYGIACGKYPGLIEVKDFIFTGIAALIGNVLNLIIGYRDSR